jgi:hypothetical protein
LLLIKHLQRPVAFASQAQKGCRRQNRFIDVRERALRLIGGDDRITGGPTAKVQNELGEIERR